MRGGGAALRPRIAPPARAAVHALELDRGRVLGVLLGLLRDLEKHGERV